MEGECDDRSRAAAMDEPLGEDGPVAGAGMQDRGLSRHGHGSSDGGAAGVGLGYGGRPPMPYDGGYDGGYEQRRPSPSDVVYGSGAAAPSDLGEGGTDGFGDRRLFHHGKKADEDEFEHERKHKHYAEAAAAAAVGYGLYERHQKNNAEEKLEGVHGYDSDGNKKPDSQKYDY